MSNGWTGGSFSLLRVALAATLAARWSTHETASGLPWWLLVTLALWLALGLRTRVAAAACAVVQALTLAAEVETRGLPGVALLLVSVAFVLAPPEPYGALDARGRSDPGGGWRLPARVLRGTRLGAIAALVLFPPFVGGFEPFWDALATVLLLLACSDPAWVRPRVLEGTAFYDGECGLCHSAVRFMLAEDPRAPLRFAPLQGETFAGALPKDQRRALPDAMVLLTAAGEVRVGAAAIGRMLEGAGGLWRIAGTLLGWLPSWLSQALYGCVAKVRKRIWAQPKSACPLVPPDLSARFLP